MSRYRKGILYIRRMRQGDQADSWLTAVQMAAKEMISKKHKRKPPMVLVRHGFDSDAVMDVDYSKRDLENRIFGKGAGSNVGGNRFKRIARRWKVKQEAA
ncbi:hypothetical protein [Pseudaeromonas paramecii]|uniref:PH domain-containing protein n=1 Tax=Pseudaeromonas paramecii TaxID=2138166 RepID=A0ABP8PYB6_9GAMM